jgi:hypothetical protein
MKKKIVRLIVMVAIVAVAMFAGCIEEKQVKNYSNLEITEVSYESGQVKVFGAADLPDGAEINLRLVTPDRFYPPQDAKVVSGSFTMVFGPFEDAYDFNREPYEVIASCVAKSQPDFVRKLIGTNGEHLTGNLVTRTWRGDTMLHTTRKFNGDSDTVGADWCSNDTKRMSAFAQKVIAKLEEPLQKQQWNTIQARHSTLKEEYSEIEDWLYDTKWKSNSVPQWVWEVELQIDALLNRVEYACHKQEENSIVAGGELENALKFEITEIKSLLRTGHYTYE